MRLVRDEERDCLSDLMDKFLLVPGQRLGVLLGINDQEWRESERSPLCLGNPWVPPRHKVSQRRQELEMTGPTFRIRGGSFCESSEIEPREVTHVNV